MPNKLRTREQEMSKIKNGYNYKHARLHRLDITIPSEGYLKKIKSAQDSVRQ